MAATGTVKHQRRRGTGRIRNGPSAVDTVNGRVRFARRTVAPLTWLGQLWPKSSRSTYDNNIDSTSWGDSPRTRYAIIFNVWKFSFFRTVRVKTRHCVTRPRFSGREKFHGLTGTHRLRANFNSRDLIQLFRNRLSIGHPLVVINF